VVVLCLSFVTESRVIAQPVVLFVNYIFWILPAVGEIFSSLLRFVLITVFFYKIVCDSAIVPILPLQSYYNKHKSVGLFLSVCVYCIFM